MKKYNLRFKMLPAVILALTLLPRNAFGQPITLEASATFLREGNKTMAFFYCKTGKSQLFFLNHVLTWSKIGQDGRERYLSINWDLVQHGKNMGYHVESRTESVFAGLRGSMMDEPVMFIMWKKELVASDHGEYICRLHDFDRNLLAESAVPILYYDQGLALTPYRIDTKSGIDVTINCQHNVTATGGGSISIDHVTNDGDRTRVTRIFSDGKATSRRYETSTKSAADGVQYNFVTIKNISRSDEGHFVCSLEKDKIIVTSTNSSILVDAPKLGVSPLYFLKVPHDAEGHFKCSCDEANLAVCKEHNMAWALSNQTTEDTTFIYKDKQLLGDPQLYQIIPTDNGASKNLTIHGLKAGITEGDYVCSLHHRVTGAEISHASLPVSVVPVSLRSMALMENNNDIHNIRLLCILSGTTWDAHYFDTHNIVWVRRRSGDAQTVATNGLLADFIDKTRYVLVFDTKHNYSILTITSIGEPDYGDYVCQLVNTLTKSVVLKKTLKMYGSNNTSTFGT